jgi:hypothetical protein
MFLAPRSLSSAVAGPARGWRSDAGGCRGPDLFRTPTPVTTVPVLSDVSTPIGTSTRAGRMTRCRYLTLPLGVFVIDRSATMGRWSDAVVWMTLAEVAVAPRAVRM